MPDQLPRLVVCAAIRHRETGCVICGPRHCHCFWALGGLDQEYPHDDWEQGFVDNGNEFMTRKEAYAVAVDAQQLRRFDNASDVLFSEDLY